MPRISLAKRTTHWCPSGIAVLATLIALLAGCGPKEPDTPSAAPGGASSLLRLMPKQAVTAFATPSLRELEGRVEAFLIRASPQQINMEAEIRVVVQQLGRLVHVPDARSLEDIALETGLDPERPVAVYVATAQPPEDLSGALAAYVMDAERVEKTLLDLAGGTPPARTGEDVQGVAIYTSAEGEFAYFIRDDLLVFGLSEPLVRDIAARLGAPLTVPHEESPADHILQLTQLEALRRFVDPPSEAADAAEATGAESSWTQAARPALDALAGGPPIVTLWRVEENALEVLTRLDGTAHPNAGAWRGEPLPLTHLKFLPDETVAAISLGLNGGWRDSLEQYAESALSDSGLATPPGPKTPPEGPVQTFELLGSSVTLCLAENGGSQPVMALLAEFRDGEEARRRLRELALLPILSETYNGIDIYLVPIPVPGGEGIHAGFQGNTLVIASEMAQLKTLLDRIRDGRPSQWAAIQSPPLDTSAPLLSLVAVRPQGLTGALNAIQAQGAVSEKTASTAGMFWEKLEEVRMAESMDGGVYQNRLTVHVR